MGAADWGTHRCYNKPASGPISLWLLFLQHLFGDVISREIKKWITVEILRLCWHQIMAHMPVLTFHLMSSAHLHHHSAGFWDFVSKHDHTHAGQWSSNTSCTLSSSWLWWERMHWVFRHASGVIAYLARLHVNHALAHLFTQRYGTDHPLCVHPKAWVLIMDADKGILRIFQQKTEELMNTNVDANANI